MDQLAFYQYVLIGCVFVWSGFVRSGLGFGGAVLALPFLLLIVNDPLVFLPLIAVHLLFFSSLIMWQSHHAQRQNTTGPSIDWGFLKRAMTIMIVPKLAGVIGLLTLPAQWMSAIIFVIVFGYALGYLINRPIRNQSKTVDTILLSAGAYISGTSLTGAPLIIPVFANHVSKHQLRDTLFVLWWILTAIKLISFVLVGVDLQLIHHLWLLPCAAIGHVLGQRFHQRILAAETPLFYRILGGGLIIVSAAGLWQVWWSS